MNSIYNFKTNIPQYEPKEPPKNGVRDCIDTKKAKELREHIKNSTSLTEDEKAFLIIKEDAGTHFDYELAMLFLECRTELEAYYNNYAE